MGQVGKMASAKVILSGRPNSFSFDDRVIFMDVPVKIGRSHKEEQVDIQSYQSLSGVGTM